MKIRAPLTGGVFCFLLLLLVCLMAGCNKSVQATGADSQQGPALPVKVQLAKPQRVAQYTEYIATLKSRNSVLLQPQVEGQITNIFVQSGDRVQAGTPLLQIDPRKQQAAVHNLEANRKARLANLELARRELERRKELFEAGVISRQDLDQTQTAYDAARADVEALEAGVREQEVQLRYYKVKAPEAGIVGDIPVRVGDRVKTDTVLTTLDKGGELEAYISIPAEKSGDVRLGTPVEIIGQEGKAAARGKVSFVSPRVDPETQLLLIKAMVANQDRRFRNAQVVHARVLWEEVERPVIPVTAVARVTGQTFAYLAEGDGKNTVARQRAVRLGEIVGNDYVVLDGIKPGERIITTGVQMLADGMPVAPQS